MSRTFYAYILSAERPFFIGDLEYLSVPALLGQYGIMAHHSNCVLALKPGEMHYREPGKENVYAAVSDGIIKIEDNTVVMLVDTAELPEEIDINRAKESEARAREEMLQKRSMREFKEAEGQLARALNRLRVKHNYGNPSGRNSVR